MAGSLPARSTQDIEAARQEEKQFSSVKLAFHRPLAHSHNLSPSGPTVPALFMCLLQSVPHLPACSFSPAQTQGRLLYGGDGVGGKLTPTDQFFPRTC